MATTIEARITRYEAVSLIGERAKDIAKGSSITVKDPGTDDPLIIAEIERKLKKFPIKLVREYPNGERKVLNPNMMIWPE
jgi:DNA-directed RNA polymerase subunit K/omega